MTHGEQRKKALDRFIKGDVKPPMHLLLARSKIPPPQNEVIKALLDVTKDYGKIEGFGKRSCGILRRRYWSSLNYLTVLVFIVFGLRPNEATILRRQDFVFDPLQEVNIDLPPYCFIWKGDTASGDPKAQSQRVLPIPTNAIHIFKEQFGILQLKPNDFVLSGKDSGNSYPICVDHVEHRFKEIARAAALKYPDLRINPKAVFPYIGRQKLSTLLTDQEKDAGVMAGEILGHRASGGRSQGRMAREYYIRHSLEEQRDAMDKALEDILGPVKPSRDILPPPLQEESSA